MGVVFCDQREGGPIYSRGHCAVVVEMARIFLCGSETRKLVLVAVVSPYTVKDQASLRHQDSLGPCKCWADEQGAVIRPQPKEGPQGPREQ